MKPVAKEMFRYFCSIPTRWGDEDRIGHVNNAKYFTFDEQARISYLKFQIAEAGIDGGENRLILAHIGCDFLKQLKHPVTIDYGMRITRLGRSSMDTEGAAFVGDVCYSRTRGVLVWFDYQAQKSAPIPEDVREQILRYEVIRPETP